MPKTALIILIFILLRIIISLPLELEFDESYYFLWSKNLSLSYYDHPPLIAYIIYPFSFFAPSEIMIRIPIIFLSVLFSVSLLLISKEVSSEGNSNLVLANTLPLYFFSFVIITPDAPLLSFWSLSLYFFIKKKWLYFGISFGFCLLSKYTAVLFIPSAFIFFLLKKEKIPKEFLLSLILSVIIFSPVIIWNIANDFASFSFQLKHGISKSVNLLSFLEFIGGQSLILFPHIFIAIFFTLHKMLKEKELRAYTSFSIFPLIFFLIASLTKRQEANWAPVAYVSLIPFFSTKLKKPTAVLFSISFLLFFLHIEKPLLKKDITDRFFGWRELAENIKQCINQNQKETFVLTEGYHKLSEIYFYLVEKVPVFDVYEHKRYSFLKGEIKANQAVIVVQEGNYAPINEAMNKYGFKRANLCKISERRRGKNKTKLIEKLLIYNLTEK